MIRVMIVDDQEMIRVGLTTIINATDGMEVVAQAPDGFAALAQLSEGALAQRPEGASVDLILMDLRMPGIDGVETVRRIRKLFDSETVRILVLTTFDGDDNVVAALQAGSQGFLSKGASPTELAEAITEVAAGGGALSARAAAALIAHVASESAAPADPVLRARFEQLTEREREIVKAAVRGLDNTDIARQLFISRYTVKTHLNRAMMKVDAHDRSQLVTLAYRAGIRP